MVSKFTLSEGKPLKATHPTILKKALKKVPFDSFKDILIPRMHTQTHGGRFAITFLKGKQFTSR